MNNEQSKIGLMTFHAAHNYGSVLQAFATQQIIKKLGYESEIINYRLKNQRMYYNRLYTTKFGLKHFLHQIIRFSEHRKRCIRAQKFEKFIAEKLKKTDQEFTTFSELKSSVSDYPVLISGSDQVWNLHCTAEFKTEPPESILGYYLVFGSDDAKRIAFSSSFGSMRPQEVGAFRDYLARYDALSVREASGVKILKELLDKEVENTLDPTLMLNSEEWSKLTFWERPSDKYIFVYTLSRYKSVQHLLKLISEFARKSGLKVICSAPFSLVHVSGIQACPDCGPQDFLTYIKNAELVITDSFHGTAFSINMETPFYVIQSGRDRRKLQLLEKLGLESRILYSVEELRNVRDYACDFNDSQERLALERKKTLLYLENALKQAVCERGVTQHGNYKHMQGD